MPIQESLHVGLKELWANKARSCLSVLGIIIGIVSLIVMMAVMDGMEQFRQKVVAEAGGFEKAYITTKIPVIAGELREDLIQPLTLGDVNLIQSQTRLIHYVSPEIPVLLSISYQGKGQRFERVIGGTRDTLKIEKQIIGEGRPLSAEDVRRNRQVCVIGSDIRDKFFGPRTNPVGETLEIDEIPFRVVGLLAHHEMMRRGKNILEFKNKVVYVPVTTLLRKSHDDLEIQIIKYAVHDQTLIGPAKREIGHLIDENHGRAKDTEIKTQEERFEKSRASFSAMKFNFSMIAGISFLVGGIGIMNILLASVAQRATEIGIRKAVGARFRDILLQFLMESVILSTAGAVIGILSSYGVVAVAGRLLPESVPVIGMYSVILACAFSVLVGVCCGLYPAFKAAKLDAAAALRTH